MLLLSYAYSISRCTDYIKLFLIHISENIVLLFDAK